MPDTLDIRGRTAVVIGATSGLGRELALGLARHGARVVPSGRRSERVEAVCGEIEALGAEAFRATVDVTQRASIDSLRDATVRRFGGIDILVNAAGYTFRRPTIEVTETEWDALLSTDLTGVLRACQSFHAPLKASGRGRIINLASLGSFVAFHEVAAYCAAKAGVLSLTQSLACEWAVDGICVNAIAPGFFPTAMNEKLLSGTERGREILLRTPMHRFGRPEELVGAAVLLASDAASFITGQCVTVDGGMLASGVNA